mgnify:CR=1 FL=1
MPLRTLETWTHGAVMLDAQHTRFALWAPDAFYVSLELADGQSLPMLPQPDGWLVIKARCPAGTRNRYALGTEASIPADSRSRSRATSSVAAPSAARACAVASPRPRLPPVTT